MAKWFQKVMSRKGRTKRRLGDRAFSSRKSGRLGKLAKKKGLRAAVASFAARRRKDRKKG